MAGLAADAIASLPAVVDVERRESGNRRIRCRKLLRPVAEGHGRQRPGRHLPPYPLQETLDTDRDLKVTQAADYIAVTRGTRTYPWRLMGIAEKDGDLITNQLVYLLAKPSQVQDTSWIKPGKVAWDWWNATQHLQR